MTYMDYTWLNLDLRIFIEFLWEENDSLWIIYENKYLMKNWNLFSNLYIRYPGYD